VSNLPAQRQPGGPVHRGLTALLTPAPAEQAQPLTELLNHSARALDIVARAVAELEALKPRVECTTPGCGANLAGWGDVQREQHARSHGLLRRWLG